MADEKIEATETETKFYGDGKQAEEVEAKADTTGTNTSEDQVTDKVAGSDGDKVTTEEDKTTEAEKVDYKLKLKEGSILDESFVNDVTEFAKQNGISNEAAQAILEKHEGVIDSYIAAEEKAHDAQVKAWEESVKQDPALGGQNFEKTKQLAATVLNKFGNDELIKTLSETGYGNHPGVVRFMARLGQAMSNDSLINPSAHGEPQKSVAEIFYDKTK